MAIEDNPLDMWGYPLDGRWGTAAGHPPAKIDPVPVLKVLDEARRLVQARVLDEETRLELLTLLARAARWCAVQSAT